jgi:hypothetical protein
MKVKLVPIELVHLILDWFPNIDYQGYYIAGGFIRSYYLKKQPKDMDIFFEDLSQLDIVISKLKLQGYTVKKKTRYAITMENGNKTIQLIRNINGSIEEVFKDFDFTVCQVAVKGDSLWYGDSFFDDLENKRLVLNEESFNRCATTLERVVRYASYGFVPDRKQLTILIKTIKETDECDLRIGYRKEKKGA